MKRKEKLRKMLDAIGYTDADLARLLGKKPATVSYHFKKDEITLKFYNEVIKVLPSSKTNEDVPKQRNEIEKQIAKLLNDYVTANETNKKDKERIAELEKKISLLQNKVEELSVLYYEIDKLGKKNMRD